VSPNLLTERDVDSVVWHTWPEGDGGPSQGCGPSAGDVAEEGGVLSLSKGVTYVGLSHSAESTGLAGGKQTDPLLYLFRTATGRMNQCRSFGGSNCNCTENAAITRSTTASYSYDHDSHVVRCLTDTTCAALHFCCGADDGRTWESGLLVPYRRAGRGSRPRFLKQPRGPLTARRMRDGSYLLLYFNNGWKGYSPPTTNTRNPYW